MQYLGGKYKTAKYLAEIIRPSLGLKGDLFYEPFVGGNNFYRSIFPTESAFLSDVDLSLITLYKAVIAGWEPPTSLSEDEWQRLKIEDDPFNPLTAFAAYGCSFAGIKWSGYAQCKRGDNYAAQTSRNLLRVVKPAIYYQSDYLNIEPRNAVVYCDPPYKDTAKYKGTDFDHEEFYLWCKQAARNGCIVFISEFNMPEEFEIVWERPRRIHVSSNKRLVLERLYLAPSD